MAGLAKKKYKGKIRRYIVENQTVNGKQRREYVVSLGYVGISEARMALAKYHYEKKGRRTKKRTFAETLVEFFDIYRVRVNAGMVKIFNWYIQNPKNIPDDFSKKTISEITTIDIQRLQNAFKARGCSGRTINIFSSQLRKVFIHAVDSGYIQEMPKIPRWQEGSPKWPTLRISDEQLDTIFSNQDADTLFTLSFLSQTGLRRGEFFNLTPELVNLEDGRIFIYSENKKKIARTNPIPNELVAELKSKWPEIVARGKICPYKTIESLSWALRKIKKKTGIRVNPKSLRKTFSSKLAENNISRLAHQRIMGHRDYRITDMAYNEVEQRHLKEELSKVKSIKPK